MSVLRDKIQTKINQLLQFNKTLIRSISESRGLGLRIDYTFILIEP